MRLHRLRFDIWLCLLVAYLVSLGTGAAASALSAATYDGYAEVHSAAPGQAGSPAGPEVPRAQSIAELLELARGEMNWRRLRAYLGVFRVVLPLSAHPAEGTDTGFSV